jgi:hypothetical protein
MLSNQGRLMAGTPASALAKKAVRCPNAAEDITAQLCPSLICAQLVVGAALG